MIDVVIKIGGSLLEAAPWSELGDCLRAAAGRRRLLLLPGGGPWADLTREVYARGGLSDSAAHWMAILGMDQYGLWLADRLMLAPQRDLQRVVDGGSPLFLPFDTLYRRDPLPHSWEVSSDAIAAWLARELGAGRLILLKDVDGLWAAPGEAPAAEISLEGLADCGGVDRHLARLLAGSDLELWVLNGRFPERLEAALAGDRAVGTRFRPGALSGGGPDRHPPARGCDPRRGRPPCESRPRRGRGG